MNFANRYILRLAAIIPLCLVSLAWLDPYRDEVGKGNAEYLDKKYNAAKNFYKRAERYAPGEEDRKKLSLNQGDAEYMIGDTDSALAGFEKALQSEEKDVQKKAFFNMGNAFVKQGKYREAVQSYINALKIDPGYVRAKKNLEYLLMEKKDKDDKDKQQGDKGQQGKDNKGDKKNQKDKNQQNQKQNQGADKGAGSNLNRAQIKNLLDSMKQSPVRRQKGTANDARKLEKPW